MRKIHLFILTILLMISCNQKRNSNTLIKGDIQNLPDGNLYLFEEGPSNKIDSSKTIDGKFNILYQWKKNKEPNYIGIFHIDKKGIKRLFSFDTNAKYKGERWGTNVFYPDSTITINGNLKEDPPIKGFELPINIKYVTGPPIKAGQQTNAYYHIDGDLFLTINDKTINTIKEKLVKYPYSYHLLYEISKNKNSFSALQVKDFLKSFKGEITNSDSYKKLYTYNEKRFNTKNITLPLIEDPNGAKKEIIDKTYNKHLIVFWASWCGPCRQEIPILKNIYKKYGSDIEFVSISIDDDKSAWQKALTQENMIWKQLVIKNTNPDYEKLQILLKINGAIPYTVLVDNQLKILAATTGLSSEEELVKIMNIQ